MDTLSKCVSIQASNFAPGIKTKFKYFSREI